MCNMKCTHIGIYVCTYVKCMCVHMCKVCVYICEMYTHTYMHMCTGCRRLIGCLELQIIFCKRATNYRVLLRKMTYKDKPSYASLPPCIMKCTHIRKNVCTYVKCTHVRICVCEYLKCTHVRICVCTYVKCTHVRICVCTYVRCTHVRICVCTYVKCTHVRSVCVHM